MKTTKVYCLPDIDGGKNPAAFNITERKIIDLDRPARIVWESDWKKCQRAMRLVRELAKESKGYNKLLRSEYWVDKAREIAGKDGAR